MKSIFVVLVIAIGLSQGSVVPTHDHFSELIIEKIDPQVIEDLRQARADASEYFDLVLANLREMMLVMGFNAIPLPDQTIEFEQVVGGINWHGTAALYNGTLIHMDTLHRTGVADLSVEPNGDFLISAEVGVNQGTLHYEMLAQFMDLGPHAIVDGKLSQIRLLMTLRINLNNLNVVLETFDIKSTGILSLDIKGLGAILNFLVAIVGDVLGNLLKGIVVFFLEGTIKDIINDIISKILFPPEVALAIKAVETIVGSSFLV